MYAPLRALLCSWIQSVTPPPSYCAFIDTRSRRSSNNSNKMDELDRLLNGLGLSDEAQVEYARGILLDEGAEDDEELSEVVKSLIEEPSENFDGSHVHFIISLEVCCLGSEQGNSSSGSFTRTASFPAVMTKARSLRQQDQAQQAEAAEQAKVRQKGTSFDQPRP